MFLGGGVIFISLPFVASAGFGVSPPEIKTDRLIPGSHFETTIFLVRGVPDDPVDIKITVDSKEIKNWITFEQGTNFIIPAGVQQFPLNVIIDVPEKAPLDIYKAFIRINTNPKKVIESGEVAVSIGGRVDVELTIGDDLISSFLIKRVQILDVREGDFPKVSITIENTGNTPIAPGSVSFDLFNKFGDVRLAFAEITDIEDIPSFKKDTITLEFPIDIKMAIGEYWGTVRIYDEDGKSVSEVKNVFNVKEGGLVAAFTSVLPLSVNFVIPIIIVLFAFFLFIFFWIKRSRKRR